MERLTKLKHYNNYAIKYGCWFEWKTKIGKLITMPELDKLGEYENFMEENEFKSLEEVKELNDRWKKYCWSMKQDYVKEIKQLKQQLAEKDKQLQNAIVPKFKYKQWVYAIENQKIYKVCLDRPEIDVIYNYAYNCKSMIDEDGFEDYDFDIAMSSGINLFSTKAEAEQKLKELKGSE